MTRMRSTYDLGRNPPTWNFFDSLLMDELRRLDLGLERIDKVVLPGPVDGFRNDTLPPFGRNARTRWRDNIVMPMPLLLPSCGKPAELVESSEGFGVNTYTVGFRWNVMAAHADCYPFRAIPEQVAAAQEKFGKNYVTITMRETGWWAGRTSNVQDWTKIAHGIRARGFDVVFLRDKQEPIEDFWLASVPVCTDRAALYAGAVTNIGVSNGPLWFAWFMGVPVMIFDLIHDDEPCASAEVFESAGLKPGNQLANAKPGQRICWHKAEPDYVLKAFDEVMNVLPRDARQAS